MTYQGSVARVMWLLFSVALMCPASVSLGEVGVRQMTVFSQARGTQHSNSQWWQEKAPEIVSGVAVALNMNEKYYYYHMR